MDISAVIICCNEEAKIGKAIRSVAWADEVLVVDSGSTDRTRDIVSSLGAVLIEEPWRGFSGQKQFAVDRAANDWIFSIDADEEVSDELRHSLLQVKESSSAIVTDGYRLARRAFYAGRPVKHSGWYPDWQLRFFNRKKGRWDGALVHESVIMDRGASVDTLAGDLFHYTVDSVEEHHRLIGERYAPLAASQMFEAGRRSSALRLLFAGPLAFASSYVLKAGFLDGLTGYTIARFAAHHAFLKYAILRELQGEQRPTTEDA
ncbi:MAG: glycosyltransferase family 2 protein [Chloracidobacterium sp.]|nr:glycosyltransferase family 2 protein [Chloracidobacterium sp.]